MTGDVQNVTDFQSTAPSGMSLSIPSLKAQEDMQKRRRKIVRARGGEWLLSSRHKTDTCMNTQRLWQNTQYLPRCKPELRRPRGHKIPPLTKELFAINSCWERGCWVSPVNGHCVYQASSRKGPHAQEKLDNTKQAPWLLCMIYFVLFCFCLIVLFAYLFAFIWGGWVRERTWS